MPKVTVWNNLHLNNSTKVHLGRLHPLLRQRKVTFVSLGLCHLLGLLQLLLLVLQLNQLGLLLLFDLLHWGQVGLLPMVPLVCLCSVFFDPMLHLQ